MPPASTIVDVLPAMIVYGLGISLVVAPLTSTLMTLDPGLAGRDRLGDQQLDLADRLPARSGRSIFIAITASFYSTLAASVPGLDPDDPTVRATIAPLNPAPAGSTQQLVDAIRSASTDAFRLAMLVAAGLLVVGAVVDAVGLREPRGEGSKAGDRATIRPGEESLTGPAGG